MDALYNDIEPYANNLLSMRVKDGWLPQGEVTDEDIRILSQKDLSAFNQIHLFAGIGGFPLAARFAGVPDDFKLFTAGFPCQPFSGAGARAGANDDRYLWPETLCALKSHRPDVAILENVAGIVSMGFPSDETLVDMQALTESLCDYHYSQEELAVVEQIAVDVEEAGYTFQALIIPACAVDARHRRDRIWFVCIKKSLADSSCLNEQRNKPCQFNAQERTIKGQRQAGSQYCVNGRLCWPAEPAVGRVVNGLPGRVDRIKGLGNAIVPQVAAEIMRFVMISLGLKSEVL